MKTVIFLFAIICINNNNLVNGSDLIVPDHKNVFDLNLYESVLDSELCEEQIRYIQQNNLPLLLEFIDAGIRTPKGIMTGNLLDLGNYYQCLGIKQPTSNSVIEGKYCMINLPLNQDWPSLPTLPEDIPLPEFNPTTWRLKEGVVKRLQRADLWAAGIKNLIGIHNNVSRAADSPFAALTLRLAVCIPKPCTTQTALNSFFNSTELDSAIDFEETFCRLPNDKQYVAGDYVTLSIFSFIGFLVVLSTAYDVWHNVLLKKDLQKPTQVNRLFLAFSAYTNTRRLVTYTPVPGALECLDGIRSFAMMWVIVGHSFGTPPSSGLMSNMVDVFEWMTSLKAMWITAAPITVDTFFMLSGLLIVYTTAGKVTSIKLLKNLHLYYLNRLLRMFPVLATVVLLQVSLLNHVADGPVWNAVLYETHKCRVYWWTTLLHVQNYVNPNHICLGHSWYLAIDVQLHIISPLILVWVLTGRRRLAWTGLVGAMIAILAASTTYNFIKKFPPGTTVPSRPQDAPYYIQYYYVNTLTRASPFFVGLIVGYILHLNRGKKVVLPWFLTTLLWVCAATIYSLIIYTAYAILQMDWDNEIADGMINSFMRPAWAMFVGWVVFACVHGYGGPVNWLLSLRVWKVLSRLSYAMYLVHYPMMFLINSMPVAPVYFTLQFALFQFIADFSLAVIVAFIITIMVDAPFSVLIKHFMRRGAKKPEDKR